MTANVMQGFLEDEQDLSLPLPRERTGRGLRIELPIQPGQHSSRGLAKFSDKVIAARDARLDEPDNVAHGRSRFASDTVDLGQILFRASFFFLRQLAEQRDRAE